MQVLFKPPKAFAMLGLAENTGYRLIKNGSIKAFKFGNRWLVPMSEIERFMKMR